MSARHSPMYSRESIEEFEISMVGNAAAMAINVTVKIACSMISNTSKKLENCHASEASIVVYFQVKFKVLLWKFDLNFAPKTSSKLSNYRSSVSLDLKLRKRTTNFTVKTEFSGEF